MKRRSFLKAGAGASVASTLAAPSLAQGATTLKVLTTSAAKFTPIMTAIDAIGSTGLAFDVTEVGYDAAPRMLGDVQSGNADILFAPLDTFSDTSIALQLFARMPFGMSSCELESWLTVSDGGDGLASLVDGIGFHFASDDGVCPIWSRGPLDASFAGKTIGSTGAALDILATMGVNPVDIRDPNTDWSGLDAIEGASVVEMKEAGLFGEMAMSRSNPFCPSRIWSLGVSNSASDAMSGAQRVILSSACSAELARSRSAAFHDNATGSAGGDLFELPTGVWDDGADAAQNHIAKIFNAGSTEASVVDAYIFFLTDAAGWSGVGEAAYHHGRKRTFAG